MIISFWIKFKKYEISNEVDDDKKNEDVGKKSRGKTSFQMTWKILNFPSATGLNPKWCFGEGGDFYLSFQGVRI